MSTLSYPNLKSVDNLRVKSLAELTAGKRRQRAQGFKLEYEAPYASR